MDRPVRRIAVTGADATSITLSWSLRRGSEDVAGFGLYVDGRRVDSTRELRYRFTSLRCGTGYTLGVDTYDDSGRRSSQKTTTAATGACPDLVAPSAPSGAKLAAVTATSVVLSWQPSKDNVGVVGYGLYIGGLQVASASEATATLTGLDCDRSYELGLDAVDAAGNRSARSRVLFQTGPCAADRKPPSTPDGLAVLATAATSVKLSWSASTDDRGVAGYGLYRGVDRVGTTGTTSTTFSGLTCGTAYEFGIDAVDAAGNRSDVAHLSTFTKPCSSSSEDGWSSSLRTGDVVPRGTVWRVTVSPTPDEVEFWASGRVIGTDRVAPFETPLNLAPGEHKIGFCHRKDGALQCETTETGVNTGVVARVTITDAPSPSPEPTADTTPPTVPGSVRVTSAAATKLTMAWAPSTDDTAVADYGQYRESSRIATTTKTSATFGNLTCGTAYVLGVDAADAAGNRSQRADMTATTAACADTAAPSPPTNVVVGTRTGTSIALSWTSATDDTGIVDYGLYRDGARVSTTSGTTGIVSGLTCGTSYTLGIDASDAAGNRSERATVMVSTLDCGDTEAPTAPSALAASSITQTGMMLGWVAATDNIGVSSYAVYRDGIALGQTSSLTYPVTGLACGTSYTFVVTAQDAAGNVSPTGTSLTVSAASCPDTQPPTAPTNLVVSTPSQTSLTLTWAPGSDDVGVVGYSVYRDDTPLGETSDLTYKVSGLTCGTSYVLAVESRDAAGLVSTQRATLTASTAACATPPSSGNKLPWAPPALSNPTTIKVTNQNSRLFLSAGKDYVIDMPSSPLTASGGLWLIGGRNVVVIGGEISDNSPISPGTSVDEAYGIYLKGQTGTVHLEGLWVHGRGIGQALVMDESEGATVQVEHCRFETLHPVGYVHTDGIQSWAGPNRLLVNELTIKTAGVGLQTQPRQYSNVAIAGWEYRHVDIEHLTPDAYALWKDTSSAWWPEVHQDFWLKTNPNHVAADYHSAWAGGNDWKGWNPGGGKGVTGEWINLGLHPGGDFVPSGSVGTAYVSPGYQ